MSTEITFDDLNEPLERVGDYRNKTPGGGQLWLRAPCLSSLESAVRARAAVEEALQADTAFVETSGEGVTTEQPPQEDPRIGQNRWEIAHIFAAHIAIARSLGVEYPTIHQDYCRLCLENGLQPLVLSDYPRPR
jgi:hypothetical protein